MDLPKFVSSRTKPLANVAAVTVAPDPNPSFKLPLLVLPKTSPGSSSFAATPRDAAAPPPQFTTAVDPAGTAATRLSITDFSHRNSSLNLGGAGGIMSARIPAPPAGGDSDGNAVQPKMFESQTHHRMRMLENRVSVKKVNPIAAWPCVSVEKLDKGQAHQAARSPLALEIEAFIRKEHRQLLLHTPGASRMQAIAIYREAWGCIINNFPEYSHVMSLIKQEYDAVMEELQVQSEKALRMDKENRDMKGVHNMQLIQERRQMETNLAEKKIQLDAAMKNAIASRQMYSQLELLMEKKAQDHLQVERDLLDCQERVRFLSITVVDEGANSAKFYTQLKAKRHENEQLSQLAHSLRTTLAETEKQVDQLQRALAVSQVRVIDATNNNLGDSRRTSTQHPPRMMKRVASISSMPGSAPTPAVKAKTVALPPVPTPASPAAPLQRTNSVPQLSQAIGHAATFDAAPTETFCSRRRSIDVVGDSSQDALRQTIFELECQVEGFAHECSVMRTQKAAMEEKMALMRKEGSRDIMTPRPDWAAIGARAKMDFAKEKDSKTKVNDLIGFLEGKVKSDVLANQRKAFGKIISNWIAFENISELELIPRAKYFYPRGRAPSVPVYLRAGKLIRDRRLHKGDVEKLLKRFWEGRKNRMSGTIEDFWWSWLQAETGNSAAAVELAYNILDVCERNIRDPDCSSFLRIIQGEVTEHIIWDQNQVLRLMHEQLEERKIEGTRSDIRRFGLEKLLREIFPEKSLDNMRQLRFVLSIWAEGSNIIDYLALQSEDEDGNQSRFMEMLRDQYVDEVSHFNLEVIETIRQTMLDSGKTTVSIDAAHHAVSKLDPALSELYIFERFAFACRIAVSEVMATRDTLNVDGEPFLQKLRTSVLFKRCTPIDIEDLIVPDEDEFVEVQDDSGALDASTMQQSPPPPVESSAPPQAPPPAAEPVAAAEPSAQ